MLAAMPAEDVETLQSGARGRLAADTHGRITCSARAHAIKRHWPKYWHAASGTLQQRRAPLRDGPRKSRWHAAGRSGPRAGQSTMAATRQRRASVALAWLIVLIQNWAAA